jgi:cobalt-zinc-cadmium efflux system protein
MEVFAAAVNGITVFGIACAIFFQALRRLAAPEPVLGAPMLVIASVGLVVNVFVIWKLHPHVGEDVNLRGAFLHAFGDAFASLAVVCGGLIMMKTGSSWADPLAAIVVSVIIVAGAFRLLRDSAHILLEGTPRGVSRGLVIQDIESVAGPGSVRDLHIWNLCSHLCALSVHVLLKESAMPRQARILSEIRSLLSAKFGIVHSTVQIESETWMESSPKKESSTHG